MVICMNEIEEIRSILCVNEPTPNFAKSVCRGLETVGDEKVKKMLEYLKTHEVGNGSDVLKLLSDLRGVPKWNAELGKFVVPEE